jgi:hypothetical protein
MEMSEAMLLPVLWSDNEDLDLFKLRPPSFMANAFARLFCVFSSESDYLFIKNK